MIYADIYPCGKSRFTLYSDDGRTNAYENGEFTLTEIVCDESDKTVITAAASNELFFVKRMNLKIHVNAVPESVKADGKNAEKRFHLKELETTANGWFYDDFSRVLYIASDIGGLCSELVIEYKDEPVRKPHRDENITSGKQDIPSFIFNDSLN